MKDMLVCILGFPEKKYEVKSLWTKVNLWFLSDNKNGRKKDFLRREALFLSRDFKEICRGASANILTRLTDLQVVSKMVSENLNTEKVLTGT